MRIFKTSLMALTVLLGLALTFSSCSKEEDPVIVLTPQELMEAIQGDWRLSDYYIPKDFPAQVAVEKFHIRFTDTIGFVVNQNNQGGCTSSTETTLVIEGDNLKLNPVNGLFRIPSFTRMIMKSNSPCLRALYLP